MIGRADIEGSKSNVASVMLLLIHFAAISIKRVTISVGDSSFFDLADQISGCMFLHYYHNA